MENKDTNSGNNQYLPNVAKKTSKEERLAKALRDNLRRRKAAPNSGTDSNTEK